LEMKRYNPNSHHRQSIRLKGYDYSQSGLYFITICTQNRENILGEIKNGEMVLNEYGQIAYDEWFNLPKRSCIVKPDVFVVMPNHIHGVIQITVGAPLAGARNAGAWVNRAPARGAPTTTIGNIVGAYKSLVSNRCLDIYKSKNIIMGKLWQRNYYEHVIRNEKDYVKISEYILNNPINWLEDTYHG